MGGFFGVTSKSDCMMDVFFGVDYHSHLGTRQSDRAEFENMKQIPVHELIKDKNLLFVDDSIVRGTQLRETVEFLYDNGAKSVHMRSACPPIMYSCKYLNFSRGNSDMDLLARRVIQELEGDEGHNHIEEYADSKTERGQCLLKAICKKFGFDSLGYQSPVSYTHLTLPTILLV